MWKGSQALLLPCCFFELWYLCFPSMYLSFLRREQGHTESFGEVNVQPHFRANMGERFLQSPDTYLCIQKCWLTILLIKTVEHKLSLPAHILPVFFWAVSAMLLSFRNTLSADLGGEANRTATRDDDAHSARRNEFQAQKCKTVNVSWYHAKIFRGLFQKMMSLFFSFPPTHFVSQV